MSYSQTDYEEALALRKEGKDDASIRMVLASKRIPSPQIDAIFFALDEALPRNKIKQIKGYEGDETRRKIERRDFYILMLGLIVIGLVLGGIGYFMQIQILMYVGNFIGVAAFVFTLYSLRDDLREWIRRK